MANVGPTYWYVRDNSASNAAGGGTVGWSSVAQWQATHSYTAGTLVRQVTSPTAGNERVFVCIIAGTSLSSQPSWTVTKGAKTAEAAGPTWQECTGQPAVNGDLTNCPTWLQNKNTAVTLGMIIQNAGGTAIFICSTAGTTGNGAEPTWNTTAGNTTADNTATWTCIGSSFSAWAAPFARLASAYGTNWALGGATIFIADDHSESQSTAINITSSASASAGQTYGLCVDHTLSVPPTGSSALKTAAQVTATAGVTQTLASGYYYGVKFNTTAGGGWTSVGGTSSLLYLDNCQLTSSGPSTIGVTTTGTVNKVVLNNTTTTCSSGGLTIKGTVIMKNVTSPTSNISTLITGGNGNGGILVFDGCDMSNFSAANSLVNTATGSTLITVQNCKLTASWTPWGASAGGGNELTILQSSSSAQPYNNVRYTANGSQVNETTIVRTGGATDSGQALSWKVVTLAASTWIQPFDCIPLSIWNTTTGSTVNVTVYITCSIASLNNDDVWMDVEYMGSSATPISSFATTSKSNILASNAALTTDTSTWGGSTTNKYKLVASITPQTAGLIYATVKVAKASSTIYIDPVINLL